MSKFRRYVPQKIRFFVAFLSIFPILLLVLLLGTIRRFSLGIFDLLTDAYHGRGMKGRVEYYIIDRMLK